MTVSEIFKLFKKFFNYQKHLFKVFFKTAFEYNHNQVNQWNY